MKAMRLTSIVALTMLFSTACMGMRWNDDPKPTPKVPIPEDAKLTFVEVARFDVPNANQGVGVDEYHFYAVDNTVITKHDKPTSRIRVDFGFS